jgi:CRISPR-associated protein Csb2
MSSNPSQVPSRALIIEVRFVEGRYHGRDDWPPSPFRLFQALVAGAYGGRWVTEPEDRKDAAFRWLERLEAPHIAASRRERGASTNHFVPNNDLDAVSGDPLRVEEIRVRKRLTPSLFERETPIIYAWPYQEGEAEASMIVTFAERLHTLGFGIDAAHARAEAISWDEAEARLVAHRGPILRPTGAVPRGPTCPTAGSVDSLKRRYRDGSRRFRSQGKETLFSNPVKARFRQVAYDSPPARLVFDLIAPDGALYPWRVDRIVTLTERVRDGAAGKLKGALGQEVDTIQATIVGLRDANDSNKASRVRITPLPSIGHRHADHAIRRILIEIPPACRMFTGDVQWAFSGLPVVSDNGEILCELAAGGDRGMLEHFGLDDAAPARLWRSVSPVALPLQAARRRIDPRRVHERAEQKAGDERAGENARAIAALRDALRHANVKEKVETIRVQREPFEPKGERVEAFTPGTRFPKERLWHVEVAFAEPVRGPLVLGDGRYLGLGLMAPVKDDWRDVMVFPLPADARIAIDDRLNLLRAVRRALMALAKTRDGAVETLFSGHERDGAKANSGRHRHVFLAGADLNRDGYLDDLIVAAPWACDRSARPERREPSEFDRVAASLKTVRAGRVGVIKLGSPKSPRPGGELFGPSRVWESETAYRTTRHARRGENMNDAIARDVIAECERRGLPCPEVEILGSDAGPNGGGLEARLRLRFAVAVDGPILIGRDSHAGGGLFKATPR